MTVLIMGIISFIVIVTLLCDRADLKVRLNNQLCDYRILKTKHDYMCNYVINDAELAPDGTYFILSYLNIMQNLGTGIWYYISNEIDVNCGCDIDGDILYLYRNAIESEEKNAENKTT